MSETIEKPAPKRLSYTEALNMAQLCHRDGLWEQAEQLYRTLRKLEPGDANAMHFFGVLRHQQGHSGEAPELIRESIGIDPNKLVAAEAAFKGALERNATFADAHTNLGSLYGVKSRHDEALHHLFEAIRPEPEDLRPRRSLGRVYVKRGDKKKAAEVFRDCVLRDPDSVEARDFLAAVTGENVPERAPDVYVSELFDTFASSFDAKQACVLRDAQPHERSVHCAADCHQQPAQRKRHLRAMSRQTGRPSRRTRGVEMTAFER